MVGKRDTTLEAVHLALLSDAPRLRSDLIGCRSIYRTLTLMKLSLRRRTQTRADTSSKYLCSLVGLASLEESDTASLPQGTTAASTSMPEYAFLIFKDLDLDLGSDSGEHDADQ